MKRVILLFGALASFLSSYAQTPYFHWAKTMGGVMQDAGTSIVGDPWGNVYTLGSFQKDCDFSPGAGSTIVSAQLNSDIFITKTNSNGNLIWVKQLAGTGNDLPNSITLGSTGNLYICGMLSDTLDFDPGAGKANLISKTGSDAFIAKFDTGGNYIWAKQFTGPTGYRSIMQIKVDASENVYATGTFSGTTDFNPGTGVVNLTPVGTYDIFVLKLDASGNYAWAKSIGGKGNDLASSIAVDKSGNLLVTGSFVDTVDFDPGAGVLKLVSKSFATDVFILKLNASGSFIWAKQLVGNLSESGTSIIADASDNVFCTGKFGDTLFIDPASSTTYLRSNGSDDVFVAKLDKSGNYVWGKSIGGKDQDLSAAICVDGSGNVYTTGKFSLDIDFDPGSASFKMTSAGKADIFISKLDAAGNFVWAMRMGGTEDDVSNSMFVSNDENVYTTGYYQLNVDFDPNSPLYPFNSSGKGDIFIQKLSKTPLSILSIEKNDLFTIFPNPNNGLCQIKMNGVSEKINIEIYNTLGSLIYTAENIGQEHLINLDNQSNGIYFIKISSDGQLIRTEKILKQ